MGRCISGSGRGSGSWALRGVTRRGRRTFAFLPYQCRREGGGVAAAAGVIVIHFSSFQVQIETGTDVAYVGALVDAIRSRC